MPGNVVVQQWWDTAPTAMSVNNECRGNIRRAWRRKSIFVNVKKTKDLSTEGCAAGSDLCSHITAGTVSACPPPQEKGCQSHQRRHPHSLERLASCRRSWSLQCRSTSLKNTVFPAALRLPNPAELGGSPAVCNGSRTPGGILDLVALYTYT